MPLQLFNGGPYPLRLTPYLSICQLMLVRLSTEPEHSYGDEELQSKYINDDGGPSLWWRDRHVRQLQTRLGEVHTSERMQQEIVELIRFENTHVLERCQRFLHSRRVGELENKDHLLDAFAAREDRRRRLDALALGSPAVTIGAVIGSLFVEFGFLHVLVVMITLVSVVAAVRAYDRRDWGYLGRRELHEARNRPKEGSR